MELPEAFGVLGNPGIAFGAGAFNQAFSPFPGCGAKLCVRHRGLPRDVDPVFQDRRDDVFIKEAEEGPCCGLAGLPNQGVQAVVADQLACPSTPAEGELDKNEADVTCQAINRRRWEENGARWPCP